MKDGLEKEHLSLTGHLEDILELPAKGLTEDEVLELATVYTDLGDADWRNGSGKFYFINNGTFEISNTYSHIQSRGQSTTPTRN